MTVGPYAVTLEIVGYRYRFVIKRNGEEVARGRYTHPSRTDELMRGWIAANKLIAKCQS